MTVRSRMRDVIVIETPSLLETGTNEYGDEDDTNPSYWDAYETKALVVPVGTFEDETDRETVVRQFDVFVAPETMIQSDSWVRLSIEENSELRCRVLGDPMLYRTLRRDSHRVARVEVVEG